MANEHKDSKKLERISFIYQKARHHRTFHADGVWAGITPQLEVQFAFFNDLRPMPDMVTHAVTDQGVLGEEISREKQNPDVLLREANVTVVMNKEAVKNTIQLLERMVKDIEDHIAREVEKEKDVKESTPEVS